MNKRKMKKGGFTLVELMISMAVIAVLGVLLLFGARVSRRASRDTGRQIIIKGILVSLECYWGDELTYPAPGNFDWGDLTATFTTGRGECWNAGDTVTDPKDPTYTSNGFGTWTIDDGSASYVYESVAPFESFTMTLNGEARTSVFVSPE